MRVAMLSIVAITGNLLWKWIQKFPLYMSSFGALISNQQVPPQRELLLIDCYWEHKCEWSAESFSSLKVEQIKQHLLLLLSTEYCCVLETRNTSTASTAVTHWKWNKQYLLLILSGVSALSIITMCWRHTQHKHCIYCHDSLKLSGTNSAY